MKNNILFTLFVFITVLSSFAQNSDISELTKLNHDWLDSYQKKDTATMAKILAEDFILISPNGTKMARPDVINNVKQSGIISVNIDSVDVRQLTDNVALVTAYTSFKFNMNGKEGNGRNCYQDVYMKRKQKWCAVAAHVTLLNMK